MALFRSNRGMHLLTLPTAHADAENTRRKNIQDGGTTTASRPVSYTHLYYNSIIQIVGNDIELYVANMRFMVE